jgi:hypothetical protein
MILSSNYFELKHKNGAHYIWAYSRKNNSSTIASGATPIGSARRAPNDVYSRILEQGRWRKIRWNVITPIGSEFLLKSWLYNPNIFSQIKTATCDSRVALSQQNSNAMIYHEGKTPGSILCGLVYAHGCALLVCIHVYDAKKILVDALGTLRTIGIHSL